MADEVVENDFWEAFKKFYDEIEIAKVGYDIEGLANILTKSKINIETLKKEEKDARLANLKDKAKESNITIHLNYKEIIDVVKKINEQALQKEDLKSTDIIPSWATLFLSKYYDVIAYSGRLDDIMEHLTFARSITNKEITQGQIVRLREKVRSMPKEIERLESVNGKFPSDLKKKVSSINTCIGDLLRVYEEQNMDLYDRAGRIEDVYEELKEQLRKLYEEAIQRGLTK